MSTILYFIKTANKESFKKILEKIDLGFIDKKEFVALKTHFGEKGCDTFVPSDMYRPLVDILLKKETLPFFTDTNTIYTGKRANAIEHLKLAAEHGFSLNKLGVPVVIADGLKGNDYVEVEINLKNFKKAKIASWIYYSDVIICLTHFKGHMLFGFGGTLKNLGMGCAARPGKYLLHNVLKPNLKLERCIRCGKCVVFCPAGALSLEKDKNITLNYSRCTGCGECIHTCAYKVFSIPWDLSYKEVQERTVEYAYAAVKNKKVLFINFLLNITKDCDCINKQQRPIIKDIGIVIGSDPVALDFASLQMVNFYYGKDLFKELWPEIDYLYQIDYAEKIGLGRREYKIVEVE
ncbi:MAG: DUF362 domain-containing protein [Endomicrobiia bacterium]